MKLELSVIEIISIEGKSNRKKIFWFKKISRTWITILRIREALPEIWDLVSKMVQTNK